MNKADRDSYRQVFRVLKEETEGNPFRSYMGIGTLRCEPLCEWNSQQPASTGAFSFCTSSSQEGELGGGGPCRRDKNTG